MPREEEENIFAKPVLAFLLLLTIYNIFLLLLVRGGMVISYNSVTARVLQQLPMQLLDDDE
jgi:hypothetical protein